MTLQLSNGTLTECKARPLRRYLSRQSNRACVPALLSAIDKLDPDHPNYAFWQEAKRMLVISTEVA